VIDTLILPADQPDALMLALVILRGGGLVAFPTDTVYGLGALVYHERAVESIYAAKQRPPEKAIPVLLGSADDLEKVAVDIPPVAHALANRFWPGPLTLVVPRRADLPQAVSATSTVGVRVPDHPVARTLLAAAGPMAVSSANLSAEASPSSAGEVQAQLNGRIPLILDGGVTPGGVPSTVVDCTGAEPAILREGPLTRAQILAALDS
jgi:L-threonylcarbamoyladenylate synthase